MYDWVPIEAGNGFIPCSFIHDGTQALILRSNSGNSDFDLPKFVNDSWGLDIQVYNVMANKMLYTLLQERYPTGLPPLKEVFPTAYARWTGPFQQSPEKDLLAGDVELLTARVPSLVVSQARSSSPENNLNGSEETKKHPSSKSSLTFLAPASSLKERNPNNILTKFFSKMEVPTSPPTAMTKRDFRDRLHAAAEDSILSCVADRKKFELYRGIIRRIPKSWNLRDSMMEILAKHVGEVSNAPAGPIGSHADSNLREPDAEKVYALTEDSVWAPSAKHVVALKARFVHAPSAIAVTVDSAIVVDCPASASLNGFTLVRIDSGARPS
ncbi:hypothetical protein ABW19_dt0204439 [Dactylella cylindrospora]|nr:hypothetical protein ABW19_dt0204439 [Dactylella cylindrospora]